MQKEPNVDDSFVPRRPIRFSIASREIVDVRCVGRNTRKNKRKMKEGSEKAPSFVNHRQPSPQSLPGSWTTRHRRRISLEANIAGTRRHRRDEAGARPIREVTTVRCSNRSHDSRQILYERVPVSKGSGRGTEWSSIWDEPHRVSYSCGKNYFVLELLDKRTCTTYRHNDWTVAGQLPESFAAGCARMLD